MQALRPAKPFNPLLGETYEWQAPDHSVRCVRVAVRVSRDITLPPPYLLLDPVAQIACNATGSS